MNQVLKNMYAVYEDSFYNTVFGNNYVSLEVSVDRQVIKFTMAIPKDHVETIEKSISSFYPGSIVELISQPKYLGGKAGRGAGRV